MVRNELPGAPQRGGNSDMDSDGSTDRAGVNDEEGESGNEEGSKDDCAMPAKRKNSVGSESK